MNLQLKDNSKSVITNDPLSSGGLSIGVTVGTGSKFPASGQWIATIWNSNSYSDPGDDPGMEKVLIDSVSGDTLTVNASGRGYDGTAASSHAVGSRIALLLLKAHFDEIYGILNPASASAPASLDLHEDTDNGTNKITITVPSAVASDKVLTLPDITDTVATASGWTPTADSWTYASADAPTFTITVPSGAASLYSVGMRIKLTQTTVKYFIITAVADTVLTVYGGTDYTLVDAAISAISYSTQKAPLGFPLSPIKWTVEVTDTASRTQSTPTQNVWYNLGSITISVPIGCWRVSYKASVNPYDANSAAADQKTTLSTANNSESDADFTARVLAFGTATGGAYGEDSVFIEKYLVLAAKTSYYLNSLTTQSGQSNITINGDLAKTIIRAVCAYL